LLNKRVSKITVREEQTPLNVVRTHCFYLLGLYNRIGDVMVSVLDSSKVAHVFEPRPSPTSL